MVLLNINQQKLELPVQDHYLERYTSRNVWDEGGPSYTFNNLYPPINDKTNKPGNCKATDVEIVTCCLLRVLFHLL